MPELKYEGYGQLSAWMQEWLSQATLPLPPPNQTPAEARAGLAQVEGANPKLWEGMTYNDYTVNSNVKVRVLRRKGETATQNKLKPIAIIYHGGGWVLGGHTTESRLQRVLVSRLGFIVVDVDYRMAPEHQFPAAHDDCIDGLKWTIEHAIEIGGDKDNLFIAGSSAGSNLGISTAIWARDQGIKNIKGMVLQIPVACHPKHHPKHKYELESYGAMKGAPILSSELMDDFWNKYHPTASADPRASPLLAKSHAGLPPVYFQVAGVDPLRDEGIALADALAASGVKTKLDIYPGETHGIASDLFSTFKVAEAIEYDLERNIKWLLTLGRGMKSLL